MNRKILFRGREKDGQQWHYGFLWVFRDIYFIKEPIDDKTIFDYEVNLDTVGQYIGRKDKFDIEIFEGDIVKVGNENNQYTSVVRFNHTTWCIDHPTKLNLMTGVPNSIVIESIKKELEIIGNIHEGVECDN